MRNHIAPILGSFQFVSDKIRDEWFELSINYRHSPLSAEKWPVLTGGLAAGDRLCDAPLKSAADGRATTLFAAIRGTRPTLLLLPGSSDAGAISQDAGRSPTKPVTRFPTSSPPTIIFAERARRRGRKDGDLRRAGLGRHERTGASEVARHRPRLFLIRPDGYIGFRCQPAERMLCGIIWVGF